MLSWQKACSDMVQSHQENRVDLVSDLHPAICLHAPTAAFVQMKRIHGRNLLKLRQPSRLPAFSRHYFPGDPVKLIDWKAFAKSDQLLIREDRKSASGNVLIVIDAASSMVWPTAAMSQALHLGVPTKLEIAMRIALNLSFIYQKEGDLVSTFILSSDAPRPTAGSVRKILMDQPDAALEIYERLRSSSFSIDAIASLTDASQDIGSRYDYGFFISDGLFPIASQELTHRCKMWHFLHTLSSLELDISWVENETSYYDEFHHEQKEFLGKILKENETYLREINQWLEKTALTISNDGGTYQIVTDKTPVDVYQRTLFGD
jgi:hypothetical protein